MKVKFVVYILVMKTTLVFLLFLPIIGFSQTKVDLNHSTITDYFDKEEASYSYMLANDVNLRSKPNSKSKQIEILKIGQRILVINKSENIDSIRGMKSHWYQITTDKHSGWVWGGFIANGAFGSQTNTSIKFVYGLEKIELMNGWKQKIYQIRAFIDTVELDKVSFTSNSSYFNYVKSIGNKGLGLDDVISISIPCEGGCGCTGGELIVFWNGKQFSDVESLLGIGDAWASESVDFTYPTDLEGVKNRIIKTSFLFIDSVEEDKVKRKKITEHYIWTGNRLVKDRSFKTQTKTYILDQ